MMMMMMMMMGYDDLEFPDQWEKNLVIIICIGEDVDGSGRDMIEDTIPAFAWGD
jgi:hypothetical protein